jgi:hypothetical protein
MQMNEETRKDYKTDIGNLYNEIQKIQVDVDYSYDRIEKIESEFDQLLCALKQVDQYSHIELIINGKKPSKAESFFFIGTNNKISGVFKGIVFSNICGHYKKTSYEEKVENYLSQVLELLDKLIVINK